jgi:hypothetical protein
MVVCASNKGWPLTGPSIIPRQGNQPLKPRFFNHEEHDSALALLPIIAAKSLYLVRQLLLLRLQATLDLLEVFGRGQILRHNLAVRQQLPYVSIVLHVLRREGRQPRPAVSR